MKRKNSNNNQSPKELLKQIKTLEQHVLALCNKDPEFEEDPDFVHFMAGKKIFTTLKSKIDQYPESVLYLMTNSTTIPCKKVGDAYYIDLRPSRFEKVFDYIQTGSPPSMSQK